MAAEESSSGGPVSLASSASESPDFLLLGASGFLGAALLRSLEAGGYATATSAVRLQDRQGLERLLDERRPRLGVVCAAGERGRPNISWCDAHPVETIDANITGQLNVATACHARNLHVTLLGTGALYTSSGFPQGHKFTEDDAPNAPTMGVYIALRQKMEELLAYFDNALVLRVLYPVSSDLDPRGLIGKLARFERVDAVQTSVTVLEDLCPLVPELVKRRATGKLNFVNQGVVVYTDIIAELARRAPPGWQPPRTDSSASLRPACELDVQRLAASSGHKVPDASAAIQRIIQNLSDEELTTLARNSNL